MMRDFKVGNIGDENKNEKKVLVSMPFGDTESRSHGSHLSFLL